MSDVFRLALSAHVRLDCTLHGDELRADVVAPCLRGQSGDPADVVDLIVARAVGNVATASLFNNELTIGRARFHISDAAHADAIRLIERVQAAG